MPICSRRGFLSRVMVGTAALAIVGRAVADAEATSDGNRRTCANCAHFTRQPGSTSGTCGERDRQPVPADGGCGNFK